MRLVYRCVSPFGRATRQLRLYAFNGSVGPARSLVGPARSLSAAGGLRAAARGRGLALATLRSRPTFTTPHESAPRWTGREAIWTTVENISRTFGKYS